MTVGKSERARKVTHGGGREGGRERERREGRSRKEDTVQWAHVEIRVQNTFYFYTSTLVFLAHYRTHARTHPRHTENCLRVSYRKSYTNPCCTPCLDFKKWITGENGEKGVVKWAAWRTFKV